MRKKLEEDSKVIRLSKLDFKKQIGDKVASEIVKFQKKNMQKNSLGAGVITPLNNTINGENGTKNLHKFKKVKRDLKMAQNTIMQLKNLRQQPNNRPKNPYKLKDKPKGNDHIPGRHNFYPRR